MKNIAAIQNFRLKNPGSAFTHGFGCIFSVLATYVLLEKTASRRGISGVMALGIFMFSMIFLYGASTLYHSLNINPSVNCRLRKMDHMMIFSLIAGTYTPVCTLVIGGKVGTILCTIIWVMALVGMVIKGICITCPKWFSSAIYIVMGWLIIVSFPWFWPVLSNLAFRWLFAGGVIYTMGGIIYALRPSAFNRRHPYFGSHEIFHLFVIGGSFCHYIMMYLYVV
ncbi:MAG: hemolysin III family protein [Lachnospiraceae bacterium]|nr:hemolysin III family protein [Lachnospiraceae bacterium]